jgi:transposase
MTKSLCAGLAARAASCSKNSTSRYSNPCPVEPYVFAQWRICRVGIDYHVEVEKHFYSVPYRFARAEVEVRLTGRTVEIFAKGRADRRS